MKLLALVILGAAWACLLLAPRGTLSSLLQLIVFGLLGAVLSLAGYLSNTWDTHMRPGDQSAFVLVCGIGILLSQAGILLRMLAGAADEAFPHGRPTRNRPGKRPRG